MYIVQHNPTRHAMPRTSLVSPVDKSPCSGGLSMSTGVTNCSLSVTGELKASSIVSRLLLLDWAGAARIGGYGRKPDPTKTWTMMEEGEQAKLDDRLFELSTWRFSASIDHPLPCPASTLASVFLSVTPRHAHREQRLRIYPPETRSPCL